MFNLLANVFAAAAQPRANVLQLNAGQLSRWLEELWASGPALVMPPVGPGIPPFLGAAGIIQALEQPPAGPIGYGGPSGINVANTADYTGLPGPMPPTPVWHHLAYAYLIENTGVIEIFAEVLRRAVYGETLEIEGNTAIQWLRATEDLFFADPPLFSIVGTSSQMRPEMRVVRRNAYWRMFGMDLAHPIPPLWQLSTMGAQPWKQHTGNGVNTSFREKWAEFLRQVWLGYENRNNGIGPNATDDAYLQLLADSLRDMMNMRRRAGFLAREEFSAVAVTSWFDLTLSEDTPIIVALNAQATSPADRLAIVANRLGMAPAPRSRELFELAELMSVVLRVIEAGGLGAGNVGALYLAGPFSQTMNRIIDLWQSATGERVKDRPAGTVMGATAQPLRAPGAQPLKPSTTRPAVTPSPAPIGAHATQPMPRPVAAGTNGHGGSR
jgi:hypothetical protein